MATSTAIEWTDATWNPVTGCTKISAGCDNCYAERFSNGFEEYQGIHLRTVLTFSFAPNGWNSHLGGGKQR